MSSYVSLCPKALRFSPVTPSTSVFFDEANRQVFTVRESAKSITVNSLSNNNDIKLNLPDRGQVISMKFSLDQKILAIQRTARTIQFVNLHNADLTEYSQSCKSKSSTHLLGFNWTDINEIVLITNQGVELYQVNPEKRTLKQLKSWSVQTNWFIYSHENHTLLLSSSPQANLMHPIVFRKGTMHRLPKFEVELPPMYNQLPQKLQERDVTIATIYGRLYVLLTKNNPKGSQGPKAEISLCQLTKDGVVKTDVLVLDMTGRFAVNIVDNMVVVHHQATRMTLLYDIRHSRTAARDPTARGLVLHYPMVTPLSIAPAHLMPYRDPYAPAPPPDEEQPAQPAQPVPCELYSPSWIVFQPDIIIDAKLGALWTVSVVLDALVEQMADKAALVEFLLRRRDSKALVLAVVTRALEPGTSCDLGTIARMFDHINAACADFTMPDEVLPPSRGEVILDPPKRFRPVFVDQYDMYRHVFSPLEEKKEISDKFFVAVLVDYIRSLNEFKIVVQHDIYKIVINIFVQHKRYYQLHQFLQYHVVHDSKHVACLLLHLQETYPPAFQLALDMFKRLGNSNDDIFDSLLSKNQVLLALRFMKSLGQESMNGASARRFLEAATNTGDPLLFFTVFTFFEQRNMQLRKKPDFAAGEGCEVYVERFRKLFGQGASSC